MILARRAPGCGRMGTDAPHSKLQQRAGGRGGWQAKLRICVLLMNSPHFRVVLTGVPVYFALSGIVTAVGFSALSIFKPRTVTPS
jgi:hypothetical protein